MNRSCHRRRQRGRGARDSPIEMSPVIKIIKTKPYVSSVSVSFSILNQIFAIQFKYIGTAFKTKQNLQTKYLSDY